MANLGHGRGPFKPSAFFLPAALAAAAAAAATAAVDGEAPAYQLGPAQTSVVYLYGGDDFAPQQATFVNDEDVAPQFVPQPARQIVQPLFDDDVIVPQPAAAAVFDGDDWQFTLPARPAPVVQAPLGDEDYPTLSTPVVTFITEDDAWLNAPKASESVVSLFLGDDAQASAPIFDDDEQWRPVVYAPRVAPVALAVDSIELVPQPAPTPLVSDEDEQWNPRPLYARTPAPLVFMDEDVVPQPAVVVVPPVVVDTSTVGGGGFGRGKDKAWWRALEKDLERRTREEPEKKKPAPKKKTATTAPKLVERTRTVLAEPPEARGARGEVDPWRGEVGYAQLAPSCGARGSVRGGRETARYALLTPKAIQNPTEDEMAYMLLNLHPEADYGTET